jgi:hypothetical protein
MIAFEHGSFDLETFNLAPRSVDLDTDGKMMGIGIAAR